MMPTFISSIAIIVLVAIWAISVQRKLVVLDENICHAMNQIGVQLSSRFDALISLLFLTKDYARHESETLIETITSRRAVITGKSTPDDLLLQEKIILEALCRITMMTKEYKELNNNQTYIKAMDAIQVFDNMIRTSKLIYNDSVSKLNNEVRIFPTSIIAIILDFRKREYLVEQPIATSPAHTTESSAIYTNHIEKNRKYNALMQESILSQEQFDAIKKQILKY